MSLATIGLRRMSSMRVSAAALLAGLTVGAQGAKADITFVRLTPAEYQRTIHEIFGPSIKIDDNAVDPGFRDNGLLALGTRKLTLGSAELERYETLAQQVTAQVVDPRRAAT